MHSNEVLSPREAAAVVGLSMSSLAKYRLYGGGPIFLRLGRSIKYRRADLESWLATKTHRSTSEYAPRNAA